MSLYHETAALLTATGAPSGSIKSRIFGNKELKSPPAQVYALALESCKWSGVLKEVIENAQLLQTERKLTPALAVLLVHDYLVNKSGIALPQTHGLRAAVERHKARLSSEFTRARLRRRCATLDELRAVVEAESRTGPVHPRWIRVNTLKTTVDDQLETTFKGFEIVPSVQDVISAPAGSKTLCLDGHVPNLIAASPGTDFTKTEAYKTGAIILQDKASCFPAYLLDPRPEDGDVIDACAAPGNKTTHLAAIIRGRDSTEQKIYAFEKDRNRAKTLDMMVKQAGSDSFTVIHRGQDFLKVDPSDKAYKKVTALLLDPSCSGSGIVGRDDLPDFHLPEGPAKASAGKGDKKAAPASKTDRKRKREDHDNKPPAVVVDDDGETTEFTSEKDLNARIEALASFQLTLLLRAFTFPHAKKITYSTCSVYAGENEHVVLKALNSEIAKNRGWRILTRDRQTRGMQEWPVRGDVDACDGDETVAEACIRTYRDDGRGVMGFFVAGFVRGDDGSEVDAKDDEGPFVRDAEGRIIRDGEGIPTLKATGKKAVDLQELGEGGEETQIGELPESGGVDDEGPYVRDADGRIIRDAQGMPTLKPKGKKKNRQKQKKAKAASGPATVDKADAVDEWGGFED
ncbi:S-adenosyl-L-methionine-dependent methyltransferase [Podospora appendiculata]|uniref:S-adenosyl-L-methionine-dependent methyltransferase n=1 Tax=Podospora appendiculata TaxID=314037 RepID=A0AAE0XF95_9PEZI|nr:S-adenosyl-L-methionine-dependent methyltransferase [Podospora appendiculata]